MAEQKKQAAKKVKVQFVKSPTGKPHFLAYSIGQIATLDAELATKLIQSGIAARPGDLKEPEEPAESKEE
ncbi:MAG: hypothetical protein AAFP77_16080 [Bacteroidota bacterium]